MDATEDRSSIGTAVPAKTSTPCNSRQGQADGPSKTPAIAAAHMPRVQVVLAAGLSRMRRAPLTVSG
eukprot:scaffold204992_cov33-Tisochrysis_lutea.AAC.2